MKASVEINRPVCDKEPVALEIEACLVREVCCLCHALMHHSTESFQNLTACEV